MNTRTLEHQGTDVRKWFYLIFLALLWGSSFILIKKSLVGFAAPQVAVLRMIFAFFALLPVAVLQFKKLPLHKWKPTLAVAVIGSGIPPFLFATAQMRIDSSVVGILNSLTPLFTLLIGLLIFGMRTVKTQIIGVLLGLIGAVNLIIFQADGSWESDFEYALLIVLASVCYGFGGNLLKAKLSDLEPIPLTTLMFCFIGPPALIYLFSTDFVMRIQEQPDLALPSLMYAGILGVFGTAFALVVFNHLIQRTSAVFASMVTYLQPVVAIFWGLIDGELLGWIHALGMLLILAGIYISSRKPKDAT